jgi:sarcosine oxidase
MPVYDVAVIGLGAMGAAATYELASRGQRVIGIDRFSPGHTQGSSHGESRLIRMAYFEDPAYVPLVRLAYRSWRRLEALTGETLMTVTGILEAGHAGSPMVAASLGSAVEHGIDHEVLSPGEAMRRFPAFDLPADWTCVFQPDAGLLEPERAIGLYLKAAAEQGAELRTNTRVLEVQPAGQNVAVWLEGGETIEAGTAVIAAGAWIGQLAPVLAPHLRLTRQALVWFEPAQPDLVGPDRCPVFLLQTPDDVIYGVPDFKGTGVKAASHEPCGDLEDADAVRRPVDADDIERVHRVLRDLIPAAAGRPLRTETCVYTRSPDAHFILGPHPDWPRIVLASPCSGHGFKFASIIGEILADLAMTGATDKPIGLFDPRRFGRSQPGASALA